MKPSELFGVVVRTLGLLLIGFGLWRLLAALLTAPYVTVTGDGHEVHVWPVTILLVQFLVVAVGAALFFWADGIVHLAYGERRAAREELPAQGRNRSLAAGS